jgi:hypothetical protein
MMNKKNKLVILQLAGFGDTLSLITRIPAMLEQHPDHQPVFYLGGFGKSPQFSKEQLEREGYEAHIIKNLNYHNQLPQIREFLKKSVVGENDLFMDASFCEEIFQNKEPDFYKYEMQFPYEYKTGTEAGSSIIPVSACRKLVAIHPLTKSGNAEGFESDVEKGRFWDRGQWKNLCIKLIEKDYDIVFVGYGDEDWELYGELNGLGYGDSIWDGRSSVEETINVLQRVDAGVFCNSWDWEVASRVGIPTYAFYTKNHFFIQNHVPHGPSEFWDNTYIETSSDVTAEDVFDKLSYLIKNKKRPEVNYSVCMITLNDEECVSKTIENVKPYIKKDDQFVVTDGGSTDKTMARLILSCDLFERPWTDDFEVQKNHSLNNAKHKWRIWIDADETYEHIFWNQLPWYITEAEEKKIDCISVSRINTIVGLESEELREYAQRNGWHLSGFSWINYPDHQQRIFSDKCKFVGRTHERIVGANKEAALVGVHCLHPKTRSRQERGFEREQKQYRISAEKVKSRLIDAEQELGYE